MTVIRESRGPLIEALDKRARESVSEEFAEGLCKAIENFREIADNGWRPEWPTPSDTRAEAGRIMRAAAEVLAAISEASEPVRVRLRSNLREAGRRAHDFDTGGESFRALSDLTEAAATIYQAQPRTGKRKDDARDGFLRMLREHFRAHGVAWTSTADEYGGTSLAVDAVAAAFKIKPAAASKAIQRID